jgi:hypothetical protein
MDKSGTVVYVCRIDGQKYLISMNASVREYEYYGYVFPNIIECINYIDSIARRNIDFMMEI